MGNLPLQPLAYATELPVTQVTWEEGDGFARVIVPAPPVWKSAVKLSIGLVFTTPLTLLNGFGLLSGGFRSVGPLIGFGCFGLATAGMIWQLTKLPGTARVPTIITVTADGLFISTSCRGWAEELVYPRKDIQAIGVQVGRISFSLATLARILIRISAGSASSTDANVVLETARYVDIHRLERLLRSHLGIYLPASRSTTLVVKEFRRI